jgi:hypothetical protein
MLWLERRLVDALPSTADPAGREAVSSFVETSLRAMPEHLRLGVAGESVLLSAWVRATGRGGDAALREEFARWETSRIGLLRQYARLIGSLVLFAEQEHAA